MLFWTLQITIISIILIFLVHNLIGFFKSTLTVPKVKDLVNAPAQKYETMLNILSNSSSSSTTSSNAYLPVSNEPNMLSMKNELKSFLKNKLKGTDKGTAKETAKGATKETNSGSINEGSNTTSIASLEFGASNSLSYSAF
jgi:hypothetical protein